MDKINSKVKKFLLQHKMFHEEIKIDKAVKYFIKEMELGLIGKKSSLKMIPTFINIEKSIPVNKEVIVLDAGGTNFRNGIVYFNENNKAVIKKFKQFPMPGINSEIDKENFFNNLAINSKDILSNSEKLGFCFSYPTEILPNKDGRLLCLSKEMKVKNLIGELIGENFNKKIKELGFKEKHIVVLNDTVTALLAGLSNFNEENYSTYLGFILGTGTNVCYLEKNSNIKKLNFPESDKEQIINIEAGNFNKLSLGDFDKELDKCSIDRGSYIFEKMVSGRYFGLLCLIAIKHGINDNLFSKEFSMIIEKISDLTTAEVNDFLSKINIQTNPLMLAAGNNLNDKEILNLLIESLIERSAKFVTIVLAAAILKRKKEINSSYPVCITVEGTTFYKLKGLKGKVEKYLTDYILIRNGINFKILNIENATLIGAAIAGLTN